VFDDLASSEPARSCTAHGWPLGCLHKVETVPHTTLPDVRLRWERPRTERLAKEASLRNLWSRLSLRPRFKSVVVALSVAMPGNETNSGATCATSRSRCASRARRSLPRGPRVAAGHPERSARAERELGSRGHLTLGPYLRGAQACGHPEELLPREPAQTAAKFLRCPHAQALWRSCLAACASWP
jgi:hypothetical protein